MLAAGAFTAAGVAAVFPGLLWLQIVVGLVTAAAMLGRDPADDRPQDP